MPDSLARLDAATAPDPVGERYNREPKGRPPAAPRPKNLKFAQVTAIFAADGGEWVSAEMSGWQCDVTATPCRSDGSGIGTGTVYLKATDSAAYVPPSGGNLLFPGGRVGFREMIIGDVIGYAPYDQIELFGTHPIQGQIVPNAGKDGATLSGDAMSYGAAPSTFGTCIFGNVLSVLNAAGGEWQGFKVDGFLSHITCARSDSAGTTLTSSDVPPGEPLIVTVKATSDPDAEIGFKDVAVGDTVGFLGGDGHELIVGDPCHGYLIPHAGKDGALLSSRRLRPPITYDPFNWLLLYPALVMGVTTNLTARIWWPAHAGFPPDPTDAFFVTLEGTAKVIDLDGVPEGTPTDFTLTIPSLAPYDSEAEPVVADWITVRLTPGDWRIEDDIQEEGSADGIFVTFTGTLAELPHPFTVSVEVYWAGHPGEWQRATPLAFVSADADHFLTRLGGDVAPLGPGVVNTVDCRTGAFNVTFASPPPAGSVIRVRYLPESACRYAWVQTPQQIEGAPDIPAAFSSDLGHGSLVIDRSTATGKGGPKLALGLPIHEAAAWNPKCVPQMENMCVMRFDSRGRLEATRASNSGASWRDWPEGTVSADQVPSW